MQFKPRAALAIAFGVAPLLLAAGCGGSSADGARATLANIQPSSYVTIEPATTTTSTTLPEDGGGGTSQAEQTYIVQAGDSVFAIAEKFGIEPDVLANFNEWPEGINHPVFVGDEVRIPPGANVLGADGSSGGDSGDGDDAVGTPTTEAQSEGCQHTIVAGDNPTRVADEYDISVEQLAQANANNPAYQTFLIGSQLTIPPGGDC